MNVEDIADGVGFKLSREFWLGEFLDELREGVLEEEIGDFFKLLFLGSDLVILGQFDFGGDGRVQLERIGGGVAGEKLDKRLLRFVSF